MCKGKEKAIVSEINSLKKVLWCILVITFIERVGEKCEGCLA